MAPPPAPLSAAHGADITALGITTDGLAAATADRLGGVRLWPVLDGTREPLVIQGTAPRAIALVRDGDGFAIGMLDAAGGVRVVRTTAGGAVLGRATARGEVAAIDLVASADGLLILRADQTIELVDAGGALRARLVPEPGTHIAQLVARSGRVLALVAEGKQLHGRWIAVDHGVRWGGDTPALPFPIRRAVLSPSGELLAVTRPRSLHPALIDLAHGTARRVPLCVTRRWPHENDESADEGELLNSDSAPLPLGFLTDDVVACAVMTQLIWWNTDGTQRPAAAGSFPVATLPVVMTDGALVVGAGASLGFATPDAHRFLGYSVHDLTGLRVAPSGVLVGSSDQQSVLLDAAPGHGLRERARFELSRNRSDWLDVVPIDERYAIVTLQRRQLDRRVEEFQVAVFDGLTTTVHQLLPYRARDREVSYDPASRLLATSDGPMALLLRYDPAAHVFGEPVRVGSAIAPGKLVLLDPHLSGGVVALEVAETPDGLLVGELTGDDLRPGSTVQPRTTYRVPGQLRAVDRAGHLYTHRPFDRGDVVVYARDLPIARLPAVGDLALRPSADGSRVAAFGSPRLVLLSGGGGVRWDSAQWSGADVDWTASGDLVVQFPTGVARVDVETGELVDRRCGWGFGLSDHLYEVRHTGPSICDAAR